MNLPFITSVLSISCIIAVGQRRWWGHLFGVANCIVFTIIAFHPGQWGYLPSNIICFVLYWQNARKWKKAERQEPEPLTEGNFTLHRSGHDKREYAWTLVGGLRRGLPNNASDHRGTASRDGVLADSY